MSKASSKETKAIFRVMFWNQNQVYEVYVNQIYQSDLYGFIEVEEYQFGERSGMIVDPAEERLKNEFSGVKRSYIPMHAVIRIDEVEKQQGLGKITEYKGDKVTPIAFPSPIHGLRPKPGAET
jgi:hypothetical protein